MKKIFLFISFTFLISCGSSDEESANELVSDFPTYIDSNDLRIFARKGVSESFLNNVGKVYDQMFQEISDQTKRNEYF